MRSTSTVELRSADSAAIELSCVLLCANAQQSQQRELCSASTRETMQA
jgi:hypothetical protein